MPQIVLSIAGFDPSSGAGVTADLKTIAAHGGYGMGCVTALTVQSTQGVSRVEPITGATVTETLEKLAEDVEIAAVRVGMLGSAEVALAVAAWLASRKQQNVVVDPVLRASSGAFLLEPAGVEVLTRRLIPLAAVITPNWAEAAELVRREVRNLAEAAGAAEALQQMGARNVLVTGGHSELNTDVLRLESGAVHQIPGPKVVSKATHGTGCALATAIACNLAQGMDVPAAAKAAKEYVRKAIEAAYPIGKGSGPMNHLFKLKG